MKKLLLSLLLSAASLISYADVKCGAQLMLYNGDPGIQAVNGTPYSFSDCHNFSFMETSSGTGATAGNYGTYMHSIGSTSGYYVCGWGVGSYDKDGNPASFGMSLTDTGSQIFSFRVTSNNTTSKLKMQFTDIRPNGKTYGYEFDFTDNYAVKTGWTVCSIPIGCLKEIISNNPTGSSPDVTEVNNFGIVEFILVCTDNNGTCTSEINIDDVALGDISSTPIIYQPPSNPLKTLVSGPLKINTSKVFPNPAISFATVQYTLTETVDIKITVADLTGKEMIELINGKETVGDHSKTLDLTGMIPGTYQINFFINNRLSKSQMLIVN